MSELVISELNVYPVKSLRQIALDSSQVEAFGLQHDRRWMIVDKDGQMITQRQKPRMCLVQPTLLENGIKLSVNSKEDISVGIPVSVNKQTVSVWNDRCQAFDAGDNIAQWLTDFLSVDCRLVYFPGNEFRQVDLDYAKKGDRTAFSDGFPLLMTSQASLDDLNQRLEDPVPMKRFRPNLVVDGCDAFAEDKWKKLRIGNIIFRVVKPCSRCIIPNINIDTAEKSNEPAKTLATYRKKDNNIYFGQNVIAENEGELAVGMPVEIIK